MIDIERLNNFLYDDEVKEKILNDNSEQLNLFMMIQTFVEETLLVELNNIKSPNLEEGRVNQAVFILFSQAVKSYKTAIILCTEGYFGNAIMLIRNILEVIFNTKYILEKPIERFKRADRYLISPSGNWTSDNVKNKAFKSLDSFLYLKVYSIFCNYVHANYMGTAQNLSDDSPSSISVKPSDKKIEATLNFANVIYYYLILFICKTYGIEKSTLDNFEKPVVFTELLSSFSHEQFVFDWVDEILREQGLTEEQIIEFHDDFKRYRIENTGNKNQHSKIKKRKKKSR
jgi:hypothetical protein